ncbi:MULTISPECIES: beta-sandwich lipoprotein [unclassified Nocardia]|uniref:beta-sandwich lipoprotein n=1 Tax=unclassified Nocardia TaxID=2637762 RepID=UPI0033BAB787
MNPRIVAAAVALATGAVIATGCSSDADVVSKNLSKDSDQFKIDRRVVFFNGITDKYLLSIEGKCSIKDENNQLEVTCKTGDDEYKKHFLGLSDNVSYFVEQLESAEVSRYHYKVIFKPETILADVDRP